MANILRDLNIWASRIRECRNPVLWGVALKYDLQRWRALKLATGLPANTSAQYVREIEGDADFISEVRAKMAQWTRYAPRAVDFVLLGSWGSVFFNEVTLYSIVRALKPEVVVETGGTPGKSTAFILRAMERNGTGHLYTIDLPPQSVDQRELSSRERWHDVLPAGAGSNWVVPASLRTRHTLLLGKSSEQLPLLLAKLNRVNMFYYDSDHSYENMTWEFETAWPKIKKGGVLISDDVLDNPSFFDFCRKAGLRQTNVFNLGAVAPK